MRQLPGCRGCVLGLGRWRHVHLSVNQFITFAIIGEFPELLVSNPGVDFGSDQCCSHIGDYNLASGNNDGGGSASDVNRLVPATV